MGSGGVAPPHFSLPEGRGMTGWSLLRLSSDVGTGGPNACSFCGTATVSQNPSLTGTPCLDGRRTTMTTTVAARNSSSLSRKRALHECCTSDWHRSAPWILLQDCELQQQQQLGPRGHPGEAPATPQADGSPHQRQHRLLDSVRSSCCCTV